MYNTNSPQINFVIVAAVLLWYINLVADLYAKVITILQ